MFAFGSFPPGSLGLLGGAAAVPTTPPTPVTVIAAPPRVRRGDTVVVSLVAPETPNAPPVLVVSGGGSTWTLAVPLAAKPLGFARAFRVLPGVALGTFTVAVTFAGLASGAAYSGSATFVLVDGGDDGGRVIALAAAVRPEGVYVAAHLDSGRLVQGSNPHL